MERQRRRAPPSETARCDYCRKSFGLILHRYYRMRFCSADCLKAYQGRLDDLTMSRIQRVDLRRAPELRRQYRAGPRLAQLPAYAMLDWRVAFAESLVRPNYPPATLMAVGTNPRPRLSQCRVFSVLASISLCASCIAASGIGGEVRAR